MAIPGTGKEKASAILQTRPTFEKRSGRRYPVVVPVVIRWKDAEDHEASGVLRDVNDYGIFFYAQASIPVGAQVDLMFTVPRELTASETYRFTGTLVRTEDSGGCEKGFAIAVARSELLGQAQTSQPFEALHVREVDAHPQQTCGEERAATEPCQHARQGLFRRMRVVSLVLGVSLVVLAFAVKGIVARQEASRARASAVQNVHVWIDPSSGLYHCPGTEWYGKKAGGKYVTQKQAQLDGFHPAYQRPCEVAPAGQ